MPATLHLLLKLRSTPCNVVLFNMNESGLDVEPTSSETNAMASSASAAAKDFQKDRWTLYDRLSDVHAPVLVSMLSCCNGLLSRVNAVRAATNVMFVGVPPPCPVCCSSLRIENVLVPAVDC